MNYKLVTASLIIILLASGTGLFAYESTVHPLESVVNAALAWNPDWDNHVISLIKSHSVPGPKGDTGSIGLTGAAGVQGQQGVNGSNGTNGSNGLNGSNGTSGLAAWTLPYSNITNIPVIGAYLYIISANDPVVGNYSARLPNGTVIWSSANQTSVLASVTSGASVGSSIYASAGVFGSKVCHLIVGNGTQSLTAGQVAYQSSQGFYSVASASANSTIGYGYVWLITINSNANANCLLMNDGVFTLGSWSLTSGLAWVSTTGTVTSTYPSATGNQLVSIGSMLNATTLQVQNPNGNYGEHV